MAKPIPLDVRADEIPDLLKREPRWLCWRYELRDGRWAKIPRQPSGTFAKVNDPATWTTFTEAFAAYRSGGFDGVGFVLGDGWAGLDLDHCRNAETDVAARPYVDRLDCYVEVSPSGAGYKAIGRSHRVGGQIDFIVTPPAFTTWTSARYFAVTGHGLGDPGIDITPPLNAWFPSSGRSTDLPPVLRPRFIRENDTRGTENLERFTDDQVVERILASPQAQKFQNLWRGDTSDYGDDHSRADQALCSILAYWCQGDLEQVDRMFRQSGLMRAKWNTPSYRRATLRKAATLLPSEPVINVDPSEVAYD